MGWVPPKRKKGGAFLQKPSSFYLFKVGKGFLLLEANGLGNLIEGIPPPSVEVG
jgi:hypothetical protein